MSQGWKIAQGLKRKNQNISFDNIDSKGQREAPKKQKTLIEEYHSTKHKEWMREKIDIDSKLDEIPDVSVPLELEENQENETIDKLKEIINECKNNNKSIRGKIANISFSVDKENPEKITFTGDSGNYIVTIDEEDIYSEVEFNKIEDVSYIKKDEFKENVVLTRGITVINNDEINENFYISKPGDANGEIVSEIVQDILNNNPEFIQREDDEFYRNNISAEEQIKRMVRKNDVLTFQLYDEDIYKSGLASGFYQKSPKEEEYEKYGDYILPAKKIQENCKKLYSLIIETYKTMEKEGNFKNDREKFNQISSVLDKVKQIDDEIEKGTQLDLELEQLNKELEENNIIVQDKKGQSKEEL